MPIPVNEILQNIINDIDVSVSEQFDRNFERKAFFDRAWPQTRHQNHRGSLLLRSGKLRKSIHSRQRQHTVSWISNLPYASIHNEGGQIKVTAKMKRFFWAMYYKNANAVVYSVKKKAPANTKRNQRLQAESAKWKAMALLKVGSIITIDQRQFIGNHPQVNATVEKVLKNNLKDIDREILKIIKR